MLTLACPVYNEADNIGGLLDAIEKHVTVPAELAIVYDFEEDNTLPVVLARAASYPIPIRLIRNKYGRGAMNAVRTGLESAARGTAVVVVMADLSDDMADVDTMYRLSKQTATTSYAARAICAGGGNSEVRRLSRCYRDSQVFHCIILPVFRPTIARIISKCIAARSSRKRRSSRKAV